MTAGVCFCSDDSDDDEYQSDESDREAEEESIEEEGNKTAGTEEERYDKILKLLISKHISICKFFEFFMGNAND